MGGVPIILRWAAAIYFRLLFIRSLFLFKLRTLILNLLILMLSSGVKVDHLNWILNLVISKLLVWSLVLVNVVSGRIVDYYLLFLLVGLWRMRPCIQLIRLQGVLDVVVGTWPLFLIIFILSVIRFFINLRQIIVRLNWLQEVTWPGSLPSTPKLAFFLFFINPI